MSVNYIWFDLGLTLLTNNHCQSYKEALEAAGSKRELAEVERAYHLANKYFMRRRPGLLGQKNSGPAAFFDVLLDRLEVKDPQARALFFAEMKRKKDNICWHKFPFTDEVLYRLHERGIGTGLISNWDLGCRGILKDNGLLEQLDTVVISAEAGMEKPDKRIFQLALEKSGRKAEECLYVGDNYYDDVVGSAKVGMKALLINPPDRLGIEELDYPDVIESIKEVERYIA